MAKIIKTDGTEIEVSPKNGTDFSLEEMQKVVCGFMEVYYINNYNDILIINEEGKLYNLPYNKTATELFRKAYRTDDYIVGDVLVCSKEQVK